MRLARFLANAAGRARDEGDLESRPRRRSAPRVEALDDRCLLSLSPAVIGPPSPMYRPPPPPLRGPIPSLVNESVHLTNSQGGFGRLTITWEDRAGDFTGTYSNADLHISGLQVAGTVGYELPGLFASHIQFSGEATSLAPVVGEPEVDTLEHQDVTFSGAVYIKGGTATVFGSIVADDVIDLVSADPSHTLILQAGDATDQGQVSGVFVHS